MDDRGDITVEVEHIEDGVIVRPVGVIDRWSAPELRAELEAAIAPGPSRLVVDMSGVPEIDSAGVATLVVAMQSAHRRASLLVLCGLQTRVLSLLQIVRLDAALFTIVGNVGEALSLPNRRQSGRFAGAEITCSAGKVIDISATGLRVMTRRRLKGHIKIKIVRGDLRVAVRVEVARSRRIGWRRHEAGLRFVDLDATTAERLTEIVGLAAERSMTLRPKTQAA